MDYDIAIIGGGPAGITAAIAASTDSKVVLLEKNPSLARKLLLTGGGRCNITNNKPPKKLLSHYSNKNFLKHSFYTFTNDDLYSLFDFDFIEEDSNRVFPESENSRDVLKGLEKHLTHVDVKTGYEVTSIKEGFIINDDIKAEKVIIATGGVTYPQTGCDISSYSLFREPVSKIKYGLVPLVCRENLTSIAGITLSNVDVSYKKTRIRGDVLITHFGLTGPAVIDLSSEISKDTDYDILKGDFNIDCEIAIDLLPDYSYEELKDKFTSDFKGKTQLNNYLKQFLANNFTSYFLNKVNINETLKLSQIDKKTKNHLISSLKNFTFEITAFYSDLAKVTVGGVDLKNVNAKTMESKLTENLFFAGEMLDLDGPTGGYNLKIAFSTGFLAGKSANGK